MCLKVFELNIKESLVDHFIGDNLTKYRKYLENKIIIGFDGVFDEFELKKFKTLIKDFSKKNEMKPHGKSLQMISHNENFYRVDNDPKKSSAPHIYMTCVFGNLLNLKDELGSVARSVFGKMLVVQNSLAQTNAKFEVPFKNKYYLRPQIIRYPRGGGFLEGHVHEYEPQRYGLILNLSQPGSDYKTGGTFFDAKEGRVSGYNVGKLSRLIIFKYDLFHGINPIDEDNEIDWDSDDGKMSAVLPLY